MLKCIQHGVDPSRLELTRNLHEPSNSDFTIRLRHRISRADCAEYLTQRYRSGVWDCQQRLARGSGSAIFFDASLMESKFGIEQTDPSAR